MKISKQLIDWAKRVGIEATPEEIKAVFEQLDERQQRVISLRFDFEQRALLPLEEVATEFGVTRERIRQIQNQSLRSIQGKLQRSKLGESEKTTMLIEALGFGDRELHILRNLLNCRTVGDVMNYPFSQIRNHRYARRRVPLNIIKTAFSEIGITLDWDIESVC